MKPRSPRARRSISWLGALLAIVAAGVIAWFVHTRLNRELVDMPETERCALYERTLETLRTTCMRAHGQEPTAFCGRQADFVTRFPECDSECRDLAARFAPQPSR